MFIPGLITNAPNFIPNLQAWYDGSDSSTMTMAYQNLAATGTGVISTNTITASATVANLVQAGEKLRIAGTDIYTVASVSTTTITTVETLSSNYIAGSAMALQRVSQWNDKSGHAYNLIQATAASQAVYVPNKFNSQSVLTWDSANKYPVPAGLYGALSASNCTIFTVSASTAPTNSTQQRLIGIADAGNGRIYVETNTTGSNFAGFNYSLTAASAITVGITYTNFGILAAQRNGTTRSIRYNNGSAQTDSLGVNVTATGGNIGQSQAGSSGMIGNVGEIIMYNRALSTTEIIAVNRYLASKWAISIS